jgi:hypothetical protein
MDGREGTNASGGIVSSPSQTIPGEPSTSSITRVPLTHKDPSKSLITKALHHCRDYKTAVKKGRAFEPYSFVERKTRAATRSTVPYGPTGSELVELAQLTFRGPDACLTMYTVVCERLDRSNQKWRNVTKGLEVLRYVLVRGSQGFVDTVKGDPSIVDTLIRLEGFAYVTSDAASRDVGASVRQKAKELRALLEDEHLLMTARAQGEAQSMRMAGIERQVDLDSGLDGPEGGRERGDAVRGVEPRTLDVAHQRTLSNESTLSSTKGVSDEENARYMNALKKLLTRMENSVCADCAMTSASRPDWASVNLGVFLCLRCAGIHRSLGVHVSQVRSCSLDVWTFEQLECMVRCGGNVVANSYWEYGLERKPDVQTVGDLEHFITEKYVENKFVPGDAVWPPEDDARVDEEIEHVLLEAMDPEQAAAYVKRCNASKEETGKDNVTETEGTLPLISLMDDDIGVVPLVSVSSETRERRDVFGVAGLEADPFEPSIKLECPPDRLDASRATENESVMPAEGTAEEDIIPTSEDGEKAHARRKAGVDLAAHFSAQVDVGKDEHCRGDAIKEGGANPGQTLPERTAAFLPVPGPALLKPHERKARDMMTNLLDDFDISSSIASSVSPRQPRPTSGGNAAPMASMRK